MSDLNTSVGGASSAMSRQQLGLERRIAWLEEDVSVLHRRLRDEWGEGGSGFASGDQGLRSLVARLDGELAAERRTRENLEARLSSLEGSLQAERHDREAQLRLFSTELDSTMKALINRIDEGLSAGAASMRERTDQTEARLRTLISRVDQGLSVGAAALQDTLAGAGATPAEQVAQQAPGWRSPKSSTSPTKVGQSAAAVPGQRRYPADSPAPTVVATATAQGSADAGPDNLMQTYSQLQQENRWLRERRAQMYGASATPGQGITPSCTPSLAYPGTLQVPGTGLGGGGASTGSAGGSPVGVGISGRPVSAHATPGGRYQGRH